MAGLVTLRVSRASVILCVLCVEQGVRQRTLYKVRMELFRAYAPGRLMELIDLRVSKSSSNSSVASFQLCGLDSLFPLPSLGFLMRRMAVLP